jgi:hypothetical protein
VSPVPALSEVSFDPDIQGDVKEMSFDPDVTDTSPHELLRKLASKIQNNKATMYAAQHEAAAYKLQLQDMKNAMEKQHASWTTAAIGTTTASATVGDAMLHESFTSSFLCSPGWQTANPSMLSKPAAEFNDSEPAGVTFRISSK